MKVDFPVFLGVAVLLHLAIIRAMPAQESAAMTGGEGGESEVSIMPATRTIVDMVKDWDRPPDADDPVKVVAPEMPQAQPPVQTDTGAPDAATTLPPTQRSPVAAQVAVPPAAMAPVQLPRTLPRPDEVDQQDTSVQRDVSRPTAPQAPAPAQPPVDTTPPQQSAANDAPVANARPRARPDRLAAPAPKRETPKAQPRAEPRTQPAERNSQARAGSTSAGTGGSSQAGLAQNAGSSRLSASTQQRLIATWGAQIRSRIERRKRSPGGRGRVVLRIFVAASGQVTRLGIARSSGNARLDDAAMRAVRNAGRMPAAPKQLGGQGRSFNLPMEFN